MAVSPRQAPSAFEAARLVRYDDVCGLCNRLGQFLLAHDRRGMRAMTWYARSGIARARPNP